MRIRELTAVRGVEGPTGINTPAENCIEFEEAPQDEKVPAQEVQSRKGEVASPNHQRDKEIPEYCRNGRNQKEPNHDDAVHRKEFVVGFGCEQVGLGSH